MKGGVCPCHIFVSLNAMVFWAWWVIMLKRVLSTVFALGISVCLMGNTIHAEEDEKVDVPDTGNLNASYFIVPGTLALITVIVKKHRDK